MIQSVMELGEAFESQWHSIKCSQSGIFSGTICTQSGIGQCRSLKTVRQSNFRRAVDALVPSYPLSRATSQNLIHIFSFATRRT